MQQNTYSLGLGSAVDLTPIIEYKRGSISRWLTTYILQTALTRANTGVVYFRVFLLCSLGVYDRLHIYPVCDIFDFLWHRNQTKRTNDLVSGSKYSTKPGLLASVMIYTAVTDKQC